VSRVWTACGVDDVIREHLARFLASGRTDGVVFIGRAQQKVKVFATSKRRDAEGRSLSLYAETPARPELLRLRHWLRVASLSKAKLGTAYPVVRQRSRCYRPAV
jgi:hypothetical protein